MRSSFTGLGVQANCFKHRILGFGGVSSSPLLKNIQFSQSNIQNQFQRTFKTVPSYIREIPLKPNGEKVMNVHTDLPDPFAGRTRRRIIFVGYVLSMALILGGIFNYEKTSSPILNSTMYYMRRSASVREALGSDIGFRDYWPWISGELNQVRGKIDIEFAVKGKLGSGVVHLVADRENKKQEFTIHKWQLTTNTEVIDLLDDKSVSFGLS